MKNQHINSDTFTISQTFHPNIKTKCSVLILLLFTLAALFPTKGFAAKKCEVKIVTEMPVGVGDAFIAPINDMIIIAGGSNFPDGHPWEGGVKCYHDDIYILKDRASHFSKLNNTSSKFECIHSESHLPIALANGCAASIGNRIFCFGGKNLNRSSYAVYAISPKANNLFQIDSVASLPEGFTPAACSVHENHILIHGTSSQNEKSPINKLYSFSPSSYHWKELASCPDRPISEQTRFISQHNGKEPAIYLIGGRGKDENGLYISSKMWEYLPTHNIWNEKTDINIDGNKQPLMGFSAIQYGSSHILLFGGDDGIELVKRAELEEAIKYCQNEEEKEALQAKLTERFLSHKGFSNTIYAYHTITDTWIALDVSDFNFPVTTYAIKHHDNIIIPTGEHTPGVRDNAVYEVKVNDKANFGLLNYIVLILYLLIMMGVGFYFSKKAKNTEQFFKGGSKIPWWAAGISIFATALSAITFLSIPAKAYMSDWGMFVFNLAIVLIIPIVIKFYIPFFRKLNVASAYQYLEMRFSPVVRYMASLFFCLFMFARVAIVLFLPSLALNAVTGLDIYLCILLMGLITIAYCTMGGIEAVIWGDVIQGIILVSGAIISLVYIFSGIDGGFGTMMNIAISEDKFNILDFSFDWTKPVIWVTLIGGIANQLLTYTSDQSVIQRYITVKDTSDTKKGLWLNGWLSIPITLIFFTIGTGLYVFFKQHPEMLNIGMTNTDSIFPHFMMCRLPAGIAGLLIAAVFAAAMSTLAANINSASTVMTEDFYTKLFPKANDHKKMRFARWTGVLLGVFGIVTAILLATFDIASLWDQFNFFLGLFTSGLGGLFMMGIFTKRIGTRSAMTGFAGSIVVLLLCNSYSHVSVILYGFIGLASCFIIGYLSSFIYGYRK